MTKKYVCKNCKIFYDSGECPICKSTQRAATWKGRVNVLDAQKSDIAKKTGMTEKGEYAIKVR
jgi:DNA-directed RNA polymerase subunit E"